MIDTLLQQFQSSIIVQVWVVALFAVFCFGFFLRWLLFQRLMEFVRWDWAVADITEQAPKLIRTLRQRMINLLEKFDEVNTAALVEHILAKEKLFLGLSLEQAESWTQIIPNILISLGLLGTFLGITINLGSIEKGLDLLGGTSPEKVVIASELIEQFREPLKGMSIAFMTSLVGLFLGILLTVFNFIWNTTLVKRHFSTAVELYLDYELIGQERNSTGRLIKSISDNFRIFLDNFRQVVTDAIERPLEREMARIREMNERSAELAERVYTRFNNAASELVSSSQTFEDAARTLEESQFADKFSLATQQLSQFIHQLIESGRQSQELNAGVTALTNKVSELLDKVNTTQVDFQRIAEHLGATTQTFTHIEQITHNLLNQVATVDCQVASKSEELSRVVERLEALTMSAQASQNNLVACFDQLSSMHVRITELLAHEGNRFESLIHQLQALNDEFVACRKQIIEFQQITEHLNATNGILTHIEEITLDLLSQTKAEELPKITDKLENLVLVARESQTNLSDCFNHLSMTYSKITELLAQEGTQHESLIHQLQALNDEFVACRKQIIEFQQITEHLNATNGILTHIEEITLDLLSQTKSEELPKITDKLENLVLVARESQTNLSDCFNHLSMTYSKITELLAQEGTQHESLLQRIEKINVDLVAHSERADEKFRELLKQADEKFRELLDHRFWVRIF